MDVDAYLARVGYEGTLEPTPATLYALHRAHLLAIPYENLDIHLGRTLTLSLPDIFDKLVTQKRGGWCFEMNGLFAWVLRELGFSVTLLGAAVVRPNAPLKVQLDRLPDHLSLRVDLERPYLADVGFGDGLLEPLPLEPGAYRQGFFDFALTQTEDVWYFQNHPHGAAPGFVFGLEPHRLADFAETCTTLQTSPESGFVRVTVCQRMTETGVVTLRGAIFREVTAAGVEERVLGSAEDFDRVLRERFGLGLPETSDLWPRIWASHQAWAAQNAG